MLLSMLVSKEGKPFFNMEQIHNSPLHGPYSYICTTKLCVLRHIPRHKSQWVQTSEHIF